MEFTMTESKAKEPTNRTWSDYMTTTASPDAAVRAQAQAFAAARAGDVVSMSRAVAQGADIHALDARGYGLLMLASYNGHVEAARWLVERGVSLEAYDGAQSSPLMGVAFKGHAEVARLLLAAGAKAAATNASGLSALDYAQAFGRAEVSEVLRLRIQASAKSDLEPDPPTLPSRFTALGRFVLKSLFNGMRMGVKRLSA